MDKFTTHTGVPAPLRRANVDTDQIIPAVYLKRITRTGFEDGLFASWRTDPGFVLNQDRYAGASVLVVGPDFGIGSSREHAVWALQDGGFRVIIGTRFADIFRTNAGKGGLLLAVVEPEVVEALWEFSETQPGAPVTVSLVDRTITAGDRDFAFTIDELTRTRLLEGWDDISLTLRHSEAIEAYEATRASFLPTTRGPLA